MMNDESHLLPAVCCLLLILAAATAARAAPATARITTDGSRWILANSSVERVVETKPFLQTVAVINHSCDESRRHAVESRGFVLSLDDGKLRLTAADFRVGTPRAEKDADRLQLVVPLECEKHGVCVTVTYRLGHDTFYLRKQLDIDPGKYLLNWVDVESFRLGEGKLRRFDREPMPFKMVPWNIRIGRPLFVGREMFLGVEHPASINSFDKQRWISLRQHPGRKGKVVTSPAVIGVCPDRPRERLLDYFERYVDENRAQRVKRVIMWHAYFDAHLSDNLCREKIAIAEKVFRQRGAPLDMVLMDGGWADPQSIMGVHRKQPNRVQLIANLAKQRLGVDLGLHVITSGVRPTVDKDWLAAQGYDMIYHKSKQDGAYCFADPRVLAEFRDNLVQYARQHGIVAYKFDWGHFECGKSGHRGHIPGVQYGLEAGATNFMRVHQALRKTNPDIFLYNTGWYSPWWLWTYDAVFCAGGDYNGGLVGPPSFSTASLLCTWRDATIRGNIVRWSPYFPINSLMTVDPISHWWQVWDVHTESRLRPLTDYFVTAWLRGTQLAEIYNNIAAWNDAQADAAAAVLKWINAHDDVILASTRYFGGDPLRGEPYGYAHFTKDNRAIIVIRNPTIEPRTIAIPFDESTGMWPGEKDYVIRTVYPFTMVLPQPVRYGATCEQRLDSHEVRVLEVWPLDGLPEPMPIGCRYQVTSRESGKTAFRLGACADVLHFFSPVVLSDGTPLAGQPRRYAVQMSRKGPSHEAPVSPQASARVQDGCCVVPVNVPEDARARVALLFKQRGLKGRMTLDGKPVEADAPHIRLSDANDARVAALKQYYNGNKSGHGTRARASNWSLFGVRLNPGKHEIRFQPDTSPKQKAIVIVDLRVAAPAKNMLEIRHGPITRTEEILLPQNWVWEDRFMSIGEVHDAESEQ